MGLDGPRPFIRLPHPTASVARRRLPPSLSCATTALAPSRAAAACHPPRPAPPPSRAAALPVPRRRPPRPSACCSIAYHRSLLLAEMADPQYLLLEAAYERDHRAPRIAVGEELLFLRGRTHTHPLSWDERYVPYIQEAGLLDLAWVVTSGLPPLDPALLTALVDRWRPETHTFHLPCGEMTITLQDTAMLLGLPMAGSPVIDRLEPTAWHGQVLALFGIAPPDRQPGDRRTWTFDVTTGWLRDHFRACPPDATPLQVERHARAWLWYLLACFLLPDSSGDTVSSTMLPILARPCAAIATYSWASCTLAHMYRQLCDGCRRRERTSSIGGCLYPLQVWSWERLPIGRPVRRDREEWPFEDSRPTVLWLCRDVEVVSGRIEGRYKRYTNGLDCVTHRQVECTPYSREEIEEAELSPLCRRDENLYFVMVEYHMPTRVMRQFGRRQIVPPHTVPTDQALHKYDLCMSTYTVLTPLFVGSCKMKKGSRYSETDWRITHIVHTGRWDAKEPVDIEIGEAHDDAYFVEYLRWLQAHSRVRLRPSSDHRPICEVDSDDSDEYDTGTRIGVQLERAPVQDYMGQQLAWLTNEAGSILARAGPRPPGALKSLVLTVSRHCRRLSKKIGCYSAAALPPQPRGIRGGPSGSGGRSRSSEDENNDEEEEKDEDEDDDDEDDGDRGPDVLSGSQQHDAPGFTQTQHDAEAVRVHQVDLRLLGAIGVLVTLRTWTAATASTLTLPDKGVRVAVRHLEGPRT
ncbi:hypothetical protein U9M48_001615 [Paspalum notatum var. saurae]|uniref:Aminotransferase-like plant mobile domain-containing protein n=1 Tax=Paspalum notatum var. saurae TaxID=547442 RepID=A0AAQ3SFC6_PASNO